MSKQNERDKLAWRIHRTHCQSADYDAPCYGPIPDDYAAADAEIHRLKEAGQ